MPPDLVILVPVLGRPHRVAPLLESATEAATCEQEVVFIASEHDTETHDAVRTAGGSLLVLPGPRENGDYARKMNHGIRSTAAPLIFLGADDLAFHRGWFDSAAVRLNGRIGVVGTNDLGNPRVMRGDHATHSLLTRDYAQRGAIDEAGVVLHEGYTHNFVDDEFLGTARHRRAFTVATKSHVEHLHPHWGKAEMDHTYALGLREFERDRRLFRKRSRLWGYS